MTHRTFKVRRSVLFGRATVAFELVSVVLLAAGCSAGDPAAPPRVEERRGEAQQLLQGADGARTIAAANTVVNQYTSLTADAASGSATLTVQSAADLNPGADALAGGDLLLVVQMQGATIDTSNAASATWGQVTALGNAGNYELVEVSSVAGNTVTLLCGLKNSYTATGKVQVIRVPQYTTLTVNAGASITAPAWDGTVGGVVAVRVQNALTLNGSIDVSAKGFRGGAIDNTTTAAATNVALYAGNAAADGALKGEGIAGLVAAYGRGAPANGGGGGNAHNGGGGGGANARRQGQAAWSGQGVMKNTVVGSAAWNLDPAGGVGVRANSEGGGRGGYTYGAANEDALTVAPGAGAWGGNSRRERGGLGGRPLDPAVSTKLFLGGGGGAGDGNNGHATPGGAGGGLAFVLAGSVTGTGQIAARGGTAANADSSTGSASGDAPGGGGGGGTIVVQASTVSNIAIAADGGTGGNQVIGSAESEGPGGGGGGGFVAIAGTQATLTLSATGGPGGTTDSTSVTEFPTNGATSGNDGVTDAAAAALALCTAVPDTSFGSTEPNPTNDATGDFTFASTVANSTFECRVDAGAFAACAQTFSTAALAAGSHTIDVRAVDPLGFRDPTPATYTWTVDLTAPDTTIAVSEPNPTSDPTGDFTFTSNDAGATFECSIDSGAFAPCTATFSTPALSDGSHTIAVRAKDAAGNVDPTPATYSWDVDAAAPDTTIATKPANPTNDTTGDFTFTSNDANATFECKLDAGAFTACNASFTTAALAEGSHTLQVRAVDTSNNVDATPATYTWVVDTTAPQTVIDLAPTNPSTSTTGTFGFSSNESPVTFQCSLDGSAFAVCAASLTTGVLSLGSHTLSVRAIDAAGNVDATPATHTWTITNANANDTDGDGIDDTDEDDIGTDPTDADSDDDGVLDGDEPLFDQDSDDDGLINALDPDSDNDGIFDGTELGITTPDADTDTTKKRFVPDADPASTTDPNDPDTDGGTVSDGAEDPNHNGKLDATERDPNVAADDVTKPTDTDGDGLSDDEEKTIGTNPNDADSDDDGVADGAEPNPSDDADGDGLINPLDPDSDNDGLLDGTELGITTANKDTDEKKGNFVPDADPTTTTNPLLADTDGGSVSDGAEDPNHNGKLDADERDPNDPADDVTKPTDTDGDGLSDDEEETIGTNPNDADSDDDGAIDGAEPNPSSDSDGDGLINPLDPDSDNDGILDGTELGVTVPDADTDLAAKHFVADADPATTTLPLVRDTDKGGVGDGSEDVNFNGKVDANEKNPLDPADDKDIADGDKDGLSDSVEDELGTDPADADSDDDGVIDGLEPNPGIDTDGDGKIDALDPDSDDDGLFDGTEMGLPCDAVGTNTAANVCIADGDNGDTRTSPLDADTDDGGVKDGAEDADHDGTVDSGETDPNDRSDDSPDNGEGGAGGTPAEPTAGSGQAGTAGASGGGGTAGTSAGSGGTGGSSASGAGGQQPETGVVVLGGGICSVGAPGDASSTRGALWLAVGVLSAAALRRRRRAS
jgi:hypothetical protein